MGKIAIFALLLYITGNPFIALIVLLIILYALDRRFVGLTPSVIRPIKRSRRLSRLGYDMRMNPHDTGAKQEAAELLMERKRYAEAKRLLLDVSKVKDDSADVWAALGICELKLGHINEGEADILKALEMNPRVRYGEPLLRLAEAYARTNPAKAIAYIDQFRSIQSSSVEGYVKLARLLRSLGQTRDAEAAYREAAAVYQSLPKYMKRKQRRWAVLASLKR